MRYRDATPADAGPLARTVIDGFELYRAFAPAGWEPPTLASELDLAIRLLPDPRVWTRVAEEDSRIVGQISILPATMAGRPADEPGLAHLRNLFVDREHWAPASRSRCCAPVPTRRAPAASRRCGCSHRPDRRGRGASTSARAGARWAARSQCRRSASSWSSTATS